MHSLFITLSLCVRDVVAILLVQLGIFGIVIIVESESVLSATFLCFSIFAKCCVRFFFPYLYFVQNFGGEVVSSIVFYNYPIIMCYPWV